MNLSNAKAILINLIVGSILLIFGIVFDTSTELFIFIIVVIFFMVTLTTYLGLKSKFKSKTKFIEDLKNFGIVNYTEKLENSQLTPINCMNLCNHELIFMGILGSKWVMDQRIFDNFKNTLRRIGSNNGEVKFLLLNPYKEAARELAIARGQNKDYYLDFPSIKKFLELLDNFECIKVKLFNHFPYTRLLFVDSKLLGVSRYKIYAEQVEHWKAPHLIINPEDSEHKWSLYSMFYSYFQHIWRTSEDLADYSSTIKKDEKSL